MLKVRVWDRERMYDPDYDGPMEYVVRQLFTDTEANIRFTDMDGHLYILNPDGYLFDVFMEVK